MRDPQGEFSGYLQNHDRACRPNQHHASADTIGALWSDGSKARRDFVFLDESGDFGTSPATDWPPVVGAVVHTDDHRYREFYRQSAPWRLLVYDGEEMKAGTPVPMERRIAFLEEVSRLQAHGKMCVTVGIIDRGLDTDFIGGKRPNDIRWRFHTELLCHHFEHHDPRSADVRVMIDEYGLSIQAEVQFGRALSEALPRLPLRVRFVDSVSTEGVQVADMIAGTLRSLYADGDNDGADSAATQFGLVDLTHR